MYSVSVHIKASTGDSIILVNRCREDLLSARNKAFTFIMRNGGKGVYKIYNEDNVVVERKTFIRIDEDTIVRKSLRG